MAQVAESKLNSCFRAREILKRKLEASGCERLRECNRVTEYAQPFDGLFKDSMVPLSLLSKRLMLDMKWALLIIQLYDLQHSSIAFRSNHAYYWSTFLKILNHSNCRSLDTNKGG